MTSGLASIHVTRGLTTIANEPPTLFLPHAKAADGSLISSTRISATKTRRAYYMTAVRFSGRCGGGGVAELAQVKPLRVAAYVETLLRELAKPTVKRHLAALRRLFDWAWWSAMWRKRIRRIPWAGRSMW